jgi:Ca2+ transporting ATPase
MVQNGRGNKLQAIPTQHFTMVFNTFVLMTLFNEINCRKIHNERNVFSVSVDYNVDRQCVGAQGLHTNWIFCGIWITQMIGHVLIVEFGGYAFQTKGLYWQQWLICIAFGVSELLWGQVCLEI